MTYCRLWFASAIGMDRMLPKCCTRSSLRYVRLCFLTFLFIRNDHGRHVDVAHSLSNPTPPTTKTRTTQLGTLEITPIALGTLNLFNSNNNDNDAKDQTSRIQELLQSLPQSTLIDTAEIYGPSNNQGEKDLRKAIQNAGVCDDVFIATKFAPQQFRNTPKSIVEACQKSCHRLGVNCLDLYQIHYEDSLLPFVQLGITKPKDDIYWDGLAECYHQGLVANVGVCNYGPTMIRRAYEALKKRDVPLVSNQIGYNLMRYGYTKETKHICDELGIKVLGYSPLGKGILSGKYDSSHRNEDEDDTNSPVLASLPRGKYYRFKRCLKETKALRQAIQTIAQSNGNKSSTQIVYSWAISKGAIPISGAQNSIQAMDMHMVNVGEEVNDAYWTLTKQEMEELDSVAGENVSPGREFVLN